MTQNTYYTTSISHHLVNAALTKCRLKGKIGTHPTPLPIRVLFIGLRYLARITAKAHGTRTPLGRGNGSKAFAVILP